MNQSHSIDSNYVVKPKNDSGLKISRTKLCPYKHGHGILTRCCQYTVDIHYGSVAMATHLPVNIFINSSRLGFGIHDRNVAYESYCSFIP